jgi:hypothetical protein
VRPTAGASEQRAERDRLAAGALSREHRLQGEHLARAVERRRVQVDAQHVSRQARSGADQSRREQAPERAVGAAAPRRREALRTPLRPLAVAGVDAQQRGPPAKAQRQHAAELRRVQVRGGDEPVRLDAGKLENAPAGIDGPTGLIIVESNELRRTPAVCT